MTQNVHKTKCPPPGYGRFLEILILLWYKTSKLQIGCFVMRFVFRVFYKVFRSFCRPTKHPNTNRPVDYTYRPSHWDNTMIFPREKRFPHDTHMFFFAKPPLRSNISFFIDPLTLSHFPHFRYTIAKKECVLQWLMMVKT